MSVLKYLGNWAYKNWVKRQVATRREAPPLLFLFQPLAEVRRGHQVEHIHWGLAQARVRPTKGWESVASMKHKGDYGNNAVMLAKHDPKAVLL